MKHVSKSLRVARDEYVLQMNFRGSEEVVTLVYDQIRNEDSGETETEGVVLLHTYECNGDPENGPKLDCYKNEIARSLLPGFGYKAPFGENDVKELVRYVVEECEGPDFDERRVRKDK